MYNIAIVLVCLAYASHGQQVQTSDSQLAEMLLALSPQVAFNPAVPGARAPKGNPARKALHPEAHMMSVNDEMTDAPNTKASRRAALAALPTLLLPLMASAKNPIINSRQKLFPGSVRWYDRTDDIPYGFIESKYVDPRFPGLLRKVEIDPPTRTVTITGKDNKNDFFEWKVTATTSNGYDLRADFSSRGGPKVVNMTWNGDGWNFTAGTGNGPRWIEYRIYPVLEEERQNCEADPQLCTEPPEDYFRDLAKHPFGTVLQPIKKK